MITLTQYIGNLGLPKDWTLQSRKLLKEWNYILDNLTNFFLLIGNRGLTVPKILGSDPVNIMNKSEIKAGFNILKCDDGSIKENIGINNNGSNREIRLDIKSISSFKNLVTAYEIIKGKPGNMLDKSTLDGISISKIKELQHEIRSGKFKFTISKPGKTRRLKISDFKEKIVQKAIEQVMNTYWDPKFKDYSHGFRPNKGVRTAIEMIDKNFQSVKWVIEGDLRKWSSAFETINHEKLMKTLKLHIKCNKTLSIIHSGLKAGYLDELGTFHNTLEGTPQGNILSPLLCNIFLNKLDEYIDELKQKYHSKIIDKKILNSKYNSISNRLKYIRKQMINKQELNKLLKTEKSKLIHKIIVTPRITKIHYIRYADDFIIGIEGKMKIVKEIYQLLDQFIFNELSLTLNKDKTKITDIKANPINFLGFKIKKNNIERVLDKYVLRRKKVRLSYQFDYDKTIKKLITNGFARW
jgi:retron-type reverse transcriptase